MTSSVLTARDWKQEWFPIEEATYLNFASQAAMPRVALSAVQHAFDAKRNPHHHMDDAHWFDVPNRLRASLAVLIGAQPDEIALNTGASTGLATIACGLTWAPGDEIITARGEFPLQYATWKPMEAREGVKLTIVSPRAQFLSADDIIGALTSKTRLVSVSHVRFDDGSLLDVPRVAAACHAQGALLALDATQSCGAIPLDVHALGADFLICSGYKWLLGPYGTGFLWVSSEQRDRMRPGPFYWTGQQAASFAMLNFATPEPAHAARRWDAAESATPFNFNLTAFEASVAFVAQLGAGTLLEHNRQLIAHLFESLPAECSPASPLDPAQRGAYGCFTAHTPERTAELYRKLRAANVFVAMREGRIRVAPHLFNSPRDIEHLIEVVSS
jgi:selenocysteine lyase/cysteine desulfurase